MVARPGPRRASCNAGELSRDLAARPDIKQYYSGGLRYKHIEPVPQSGFRQMDGSRLIAPVRGAVALASSGGAAALTAVSAPGVVGTYTVTIPAACGIGIVDLTADRGDFTFVLEYLSNNNWQALTPAMDGRDGSITRFAFTQPGEVMALTAIRLRVVSLAAPTNISVGALTVYVAGSAHPVRYIKLPVDDATGYMIAVGPGHADIWKKQEWVACVALPTVQASMVPNIEFYAELSTIGLFEKSLQSLRIRRAGSDYEWSVDAWPYENMPDHDYGGTYDKTDDKWALFLRWADNPRISIQATLDGEITAAIPLTDSNDSPITGGSAGLQDIRHFADALAAELSSQAAFDGTIIATVPTFQSGLDGYAEMIFTFGGVASGKAFNLEALVTNTSSASVLASHVQIGKTAGEPIMSSVRQWAAGAELLQDRQVYFDVGEERSALLFSRNASYFDLDIRSVADSAAILTRARGGATSEIVMAVTEARYLLVFTNRSVYFINNRVISRNEPLNYVLVSRVGIAPGTEPVELEGQIYFVSAETGDAANDNPGQVYSLIYDEVKTSFSPVPESLLASHLVSDIRRTAGQAASGERDTPRLWMLRSDGRLVCGKMIRSQEIMGLCEWLPAAGGVVEEMAVDHFNRPWLCVRRGGQLLHERMDPNCVFRSCVTAQGDFTGVVTGLPFEDGVEVWAKADGYYEGPFLVANGSITLHAPSDEIEVGFWEPFVFEDMPHVVIGRDDRVIERPGRVSGVHVTVEDTESLAVGANNSQPKPVMLVATGDPTDAPMPPKTGTFSVHGLLGVVRHPTVVLTQTRPGRARVVSYSVEERL